MCSGEEEDKMIKMHYRDVYKNNYELLFIDTTVTLQRKENGTP